MGHHKGYSPSAETRAKMRAAALGRVNSPETRAKIRKAAVGRVLSIEHRERIRQSMKARWQKTGHAGKQKVTVPQELRGYAQKLRNSGIKGREFAQAIEAAL